MPHNDLPSGPKILFLDAYDSFSNNIIALLTTQLSARVTTIKIDDPAYKHSPGSLAVFLKSFDAVVAGPGPGTPLSDNDVGIIKYLWTLANDHLIPVLGICLGFQSLAHAFGAHIRTMSDPKHGVVQLIHCKNADMFQGSEGKRGLHSTQYHSLHAQLSRYNDARKEEDFWNISPECPELEPLAWIHGDIYYDDTLEDDPSQGDVLMAVRHRTKPFWGVQFHPESVCSQLESDSNFIKNWWKLAQEWSRSQNRTTLPPVSSRKRKRIDVDNHGQRAPCPRTPGKVEWTSMPLGDIDTVQIVEALKTQGQHSVMLESGMLSTGRPVNCETGRFTIIGVIDQHSTHLEYRSTGHKLTKVTFYNGKLVSLHGIVCDMFRYLKEFMAKHSYQGGPEDSPFWGGLVGFISYEACLDTINIKSKAGSGRPDMDFVLVDRSIVIDHVKKQLYIQTIYHDANKWLAMTEKTMASLATQPGTHTPGMATPLGSLADQVAVHIHGPAEQDYRSKVRDCQSKIRLGESYELCLTEATHISVKHLDPWTLYKRLRRLNPAPFSAYLNFAILDLGSSSRSVENQIVILSSSPERFMSWTRPRASNATSCTQTVQFRPIKGTLRKSPSSPVSRDEASRLLNTPKERAENIMIVDLIRHDLHGVVGAGNVGVTKLCSVEEYETVWQLVSVIEGTITNKSVESGHNSSRSGTKGLVWDSLGLARTKAESDEEEPKSPIDVLAASLPPGSMTGAPKKRSCEILQQLEDQPRGIYSGVLGYLDVGGGGDFSVLIRTAWHWGDDVAVGEETHATGSRKRDDNNHQDKEGETEIWHIGAGGAVTSQSTDLGEWEEMLTKREAVLKLFTEHNGGA